MQKLLHGVFNGLPTFPKDILKEANIAAALIFRNIKRNKLAKLEDAIAISKSETMNHSDRGNC